MSDPEDLLGFDRASDDYAQPEPGQWGAPWPRGVVMTLTVIGALVVGFLLTTGLNAGREQALVQDERKQELITLILERQEHVDELTAELDELRGRVEEAQAETAAGVPAIQRQVAEAELAAALAPLRGPGVRLTLRDASQPCPESPGVCRIQDLDLQLAVNALFQADAEAVAVGEQRVAATTAVRSAGRTVMVNMSVLSSPYEITAVGDPERLASGVSESQLARDFDLWAEEYGLGFELETVDELTLPRYDGTVSVEARPTEETAEVDR